MLLLAPFGRSAAIKRQGIRKPQDFQLVLGKNSFGSRSPSERYCQSFLCSEHSFDPGLKPLQATSNYVFLDPNNVKLHFYCFDTHCNEHRATGFNIFFTFIKH